LLEKSRFAPSKKSTYGNKIYLEQLPKRNQNRGTMIIHIHDVRIVPYVEYKSNVPAVLHIGIHEDVESLLRTNDELTDNQKEIFLKLWFDPSVARAYERSDSGVLVSFKSS
jgi:hypothetical protein